MFLPRDSKIFEKLLKQSSLVKESAQIFQWIVSDWEIKSNWEKLKNLEDQADELVHVITDDIEKIFLLPFDKEDIRELTGALDDIVDNLEQAANRLNIYKISTSHETLQEFSELIGEAVEQVHQGILMIKGRKLLSREFDSCYKKLHELENRGDKLHRKILENLMNREPPELKGSDILLIFKWKEIFGVLEDTLDRCEDIAVIFEKLRIKYR